MLYFSKLKLVAIYFLIILLSFFSFTNFIENEDNYLLSKNIRPLPNMKEKEGESFNAFED